MSMRLQRPSLWAYFASDARRDDPALNVCAATTVLASSADLNELGTNSTRTLYMQFLYGLV